MLDLDALRRTRCIPNAVWTSTTCLLAEALFRLPRRTRVHFEGLENLPSTPTVIAPNHTHKFDFLPIRSQLLKQGVAMATWIKARDYQSTGMAVFFDQTGNIPLVSRGYIIAADFAAVHRRRPTYDEYRALRDWVDAGHERPDEPWVDPLVDDERNILGVDVEPANEGYLNAIRRVYVKMMTETLQLAGRVRDAGIHQQIYPQGSVSSQLTPGKTGAVQAAIALELPVVPVGMSGCPEVFVGDTPLARGGDIMIRFGEPIEVGDRFDTKAFVPFSPASELAHQDELESLTRDVMDAINELVEPRYRWAEDGRSDAKTGVKRFF